MKPEPAAGLKFVPSARIVVIVHPGHSAPSTWTKMIESPSGEGASDSPRSTQQLGQAETTETPRP